MTFGRQLLLAAALGAIMGAYLSIPMLIDWLLS